MQTHKQLKTTQFHLAAFGLCGLENLGLCELFIAMPHSDALRYEPSGGSAPDIAGKACVGRMALAFAEVRTWRFWGVEKSEPEPKRSGSGNLFGGFQGA